MFFSGRLPAWRRGRALCSNPLRGISAPIPDAEGLVSGCSLQTVKSLLGRRQIRHGEDTWILISRPDLYQLNGIQLYSPFCNYVVYGESAGARECVFPVNGGTRWQPGMTRGTCAFSPTRSFKVDHSMALRFLRYLCEFYQALAREGHAGKRGREGDSGVTLPAVFPLLLYSGSRRWTAPVSMRDLIDSRSGIPERYLPHFDYCVIDENDYSPEQLGQIRNTVSALFLAEKTPEDRLTEIDRMLYSLVRDEEPGAARELFVWLRNVLGDDRHLATELPELAGIEEEHAMLEETIRKHDRKVYAQGRQEGESIGMSKGRQEGMRLAAQKLKEHGRSREEIAALLGIDIDEVKQEPAEG